MIQNRIENQVLKFIRSCGPLSIPEISYLIQNDNICLLLLDFESIQSKKTLKKIIKKSLRNLMQKRNLREYICDTGYKTRYGIPEKSMPDFTPLKLRLRIILRQCNECISWLIEYNYKFKHLTPYFCNLRKEKDDIVLKCYDYEDLKYIFYNYLFLGVFDNGKLRFPYKNNRTHVPELIIASKILRKKNQIYKNRKYSKYYFEEVFI